MTGRSWFKVLVLFASLFKANVTGLPCFFSCSAMKRISPFNPSFFDAGASGRIWLSMYLAFQHVVALLVIIEQQVLPRLVVAH